MPKLEVKENKRLVLKNVIIKELRNIAVDQYDIEMNKFMNTLELHKAQTFGPIVSRMKGTTIHDDGSMSVDYDLMVQAHDFLQYEKMFRVENEIVSNHCLYIRYEGDPQYIMYAQQKLDLYAYENDLSLKSDMYTLFLSQTEQGITVDYFKPVDYEAL